MKYRIIVEQTDENGDTDAIVNLPVQPEQVARIVPGLLAEALGASSVQVSIETGGAERQFAAVQENGLRALAAEADKPRRKRRTKAEIEADEARERAEAVATVEQWRQENANMPPVPEEGPKGVADAAVIAATPVPAREAEPEPVTVPAAPAQPFDPFAPRK